jgi:hypothetical protein
VPATNAAPDGPAVYTVGGTLAFVQAGQQITIPLFPVPIRVLPDPRLVVDYFLEHDVYSDDPFTPQIEPPIPFALGLLVANIGKGTANSLIITSAQPSIIENANGLLVTFKLLSSQVGNQVRSADFTANLGNIPPSTTAEALWWMNASLQGQFIDYSASFEHVDDLGGLNVSLIDRVTFHPMTHVVRATFPADDGLPDFLAIDSNTNAWLPVTLYSSDGSTNNVTSITNTLTSGAPSPGHTNVTLSLLDPLPTGWVYIRANDPSDGARPLVRVQRSDGGDVLIASNAWTTRRILRVNGQPPAPENFVHIFDYNPTTNYTLTFGVLGPVIEPPGDRFVVVGQRLVITNHASGLNPPFTFTLDSTAPAGTFVTTNGVFSWRPACAQGSTTNSVTIWATDSASPPFSNAVTFTVSVSECVRVGIGSTVVQIGQSACVPINLLSTVALTNLSFTLASAPDRLTNWVFTSTNTAIGFSNVQTFDPSQIVFALATKSGEALQGPSLAGQICFTAASNSSAFVPLLITNITGTKSDGAPVGNVFGLSGRVAIIGREPLLEAWLETNRHRMLTLYGNPGSSYEIDNITNIAGTDWSLAWYVPLTNLFQTFGANERLQQVFYRAQEFAADPPLLQIAGSGGSQPTLILYGRAGTNYVVQTTTNLASAGTWLPTTNFAPTNSFYFIGIGSPTNQMIFFRGLHH